MMMMMMMMMMILKKKVERNCDLYDDKVPCQILDRHCCQGPKAWFLYDSYSLFRASKVYSCPFEVHPGFAPCVVLLKTTMERCFNEPVLREVPSCKHPYISHSYIRPCGGGNFPLWNQSLAMLCLCLGPRLKRRGTHTVRRAETQIEQMEPTWFDKMRRACGLQRFDVVARIAMSLKDVETSMEMVHALAFECFKQRSSFLRAILREFRLLNVSPDLAVELFRNTEQWFRAQSPRIAEWNEILYALVLANHYEEAWELVTSMEKRLDPRLPVPELFWTKSFFNTNS